MSRIAGSSRDVAFSNASRTYVPILSTILACLLTLLPIVVSSPFIPDFAFLVLIAWRLLRPELWNAYVALPLGFFNDLVAGHPLGQSAALWTATFLFFDFLDSRMVWRDYWMDWLLAAVAITAYAFGSAYVARTMGSTAGFSVMAPQIAASILTYPIIARIVLGLDRWRLSR